MTLAGEDAVEHTSQRAPKGAKNAPAGLPQKIRIQKISNSPSWACPHTPKPSGAGAID